MAFLRIPNAGSVGVIKDLSAHELPAGVWTDCQNVRFYDGRAHQSPGHGAIYGPTSVTPFHILPVVVGLDRHWIYAGLSKVYTVVNDASGIPTHTDITRTVGGDYSGTPNGWTSTVIGGVPVLNAGNIVDPPQFWDLDITHKLDDVTTWPADTYCESMRSYKNYLIALNITKGTTNFPFMVKWSGPADPGALPTTWDETDVTNDAGETDLAEGYDPIVDGLQLRDSFIIYKESSTWRMDYTGGPFVFKFSKVFGTSGVLNRNCAVEIDGRHFVLTADDILLHDGNKSISVLDNITRRFLFEDIDAEQVNKTFVFKNPFTNEVFVCYCDGNSDWPNKAMTWNYQDKTVSFREMPNVNHADIGTLGALAQAWNLDDEAWDADTTTWSEGASDINSRTKALLASHDDQLFRLDSSNEFDGLIPSAYMERRGLALGVDGDGGVVKSDETRTFIKSVRPRITSGDGEEVTIKVGYHDTDPYADPVYPDNGVMTHTIGTTVKNSCLVSGRYMAIRIETDEAYAWTLDSLDIEFEEEGRW